MELHEQKRAALPTILLVALLAACGKSSNNATSDPGSGGGSGDGSGGGVGAATVINITDVSGLEGDTGTTVFTFVVSLSQPREVPVSVDYATLDGTAKSSGADADFTPTNGTLFFEPGTTALNVRVFVNGDLDVEANETFQVVLSGLSGAETSFGKSVGLGTILNDDFYTIDVHDVSALEGDFGIRWVDFPVTLSVPSPSPITVQYVTQNVNGSGAYPMNDYAWRRGTVVFEPGVTDATIAIAIIGNLIPEPEKRFAVELFNATGFNVVIDDHRALATILDDDTPIHLDSGSADAGAWHPQIARSEDLVGSLWLDDRDGGMQVYFRRSTDGGLTWSDPSVRVDNAPSGIEAAEARIAMDGENVYAAWRDCRNGKSDMFFNYSHDGGISWQPDDLRLDTDAPGAAGSVNPQIVAGDGAVYVAWVDFRSGNGDILFNRSLDGGATWEANDLRINGSSGIANAHCFDPTLAVEGDTVYLAWADTRNGFADIYFDSSDDAGLTWRAQNLLIERDRPGAAPSRQPQLAASADAVYVVWEDDRHGETDIRFNRSLDRGDTWNFTDQRLEDDPAGVYASRRPRIVCDGFNVIVAWEDARSGKEDIFTVASPDAGFSWGAANVRVSRGGPPGVSRSLAPELAYNGEHVIVTWVDDRNGKFDVYMNRSTNSGANFMPEAQRISAGAAGEFESKNVRILAHGQEFQLVWQEARGTPDVMFRSIDSP